MDEEVLLAMFKLFVIAMMAMFVADAADTNDVYLPCQDAKVQRGDGFTFGIAFSDKQSFTPDSGPQLSPCDSRLNLPGKAQLVVFRPKVDEISLLTVNRSSSDLVCSFSLHDLNSLLRVYRGYSLQNSHGLFEFMYLSYLLI